MPVLIVRTCNQGLNLSILIIHNLALDHTFPVKSEEITSCPSIVKPHFVRTSCRSMHFFNVMLAGRDCSCRQAELCPTLFILLVSFWGPLCYLLARLLFHLKRKFGKPSGVKTSLVFSCRTVFGIEIWLCDCSQMGCVYVDGDTVDPPASPYLLGKVCSWKRRKECWM